MSQTTPATQLAPAPAGCACEMRTFSGRNATQTVAPGRASLAGAASSLPTCSLVTVVAPANEARPGATVWVALRPEKVRISHAQPTDAGANCVDGVVWDIGYLGDVSVYKVRLDTGFVVKAAAPNLARLIERPFSFGERVWLSWAGDAGVVLTR